MLGSWGGDLLFMPHSIRTDRQDNLWLTDTGLHQAIKLSPTGEKLLEIGERLVPGHDDTHLCKPTSVSPQACFASPVTAPQCYPFVEQHQTLSVFYSRGVHGLDRLR